MAIKKIIHERCSRCGKAAACVLPCGRIYVYHPCDKPVPGPPDFPTVFQADAVQFVPDESTSLSRWQRYASYLLSCARSGEHDPMDFDAFDRPAPAAKETP